MTKLFETVKRYINQFPEDQQKEQMWWVIEQATHSITEVEEKLEEFEAGIEQRVVNSIRQAIRMFIDDSVYPLLDFLRKFDNEDFEIMMHMDAERDLNNERQLKELYRKGLKETIVTERRQKIEKLTGTDIRQSWKWVKEKYGIWDDDPLGTIKQLRR